MPDPSCPRSTTQHEAPRPWNLFTVFFGISAVTIGGGYAIVPVIGRALEKRGWMDEEAFYRVFAKAQSFPGPSALTTALLAGKTLAGFKGAAAGFLGVMIPPFGAIVLVGTLLAKIGGHPLVRDFLAGAGATVPGLVAAMIWNMARRRRWNWPRALSAAALAVALALLPRLTLPIFLAALLPFYALERRWKS